MSISGISSLIPPPKNQSGDQKISPFSAERETKKPEYNTPDENGSAASPTANFSDSQIQSLPVVPVVRLSLSKESPPRLPKEDNYKNYRNQKNASPTYQKDSKEKEAIFQIEVEKIIPNPCQPRRDFNVEELKELAASIREFGVIQPLTVSKIEEETASGTAVKYKLIAGERRLRASKMLGLERVPAVVRRDEGKKTNLLLAIIENVQRSNLNPLEAARAYARLQDEFNLTQREIAARLGKSRESVAHALRLISAPSFIQDAITEGKISESQARILLGLQDPASQRRMFDQILREKISVRELKKRVSHSGADPEKDYFEKQLEEKIGHPVSISKKEGKGKITIKFFSEDELQGVLEKILGEAGI